MLKDALEKTSSGGALSEFESCYSFAFNLAPFLAFPRVLCLLLFPDNNNRNVLAVRCSSTYYSPYIPVPIYDL